MKATVMVRVTREGVFVNNVAVPVQPAGRNDRLDFKAIKRALENHFGIVTPDYVKNGSSWLGTIVGDGWKYTAGATEFEQWFEGAVLGNNEITGIVPFGWRPAEYFFPLDAFRLIPE
jgi:hypothetical protein